MDETTRRSRLLSWTTKRRLKRGRDYVTSQQEASPSQLEVYSDDSQESSSSLAGSVIQEGETSKTCGIALGKRPLDTTLDDVLPSSRDIDVNSIPFPFMKLPAELRLAIYRKAFVRDKSILLRSAPANPEDNDGEESASRPVPRRWAQGQATAIESEDTPPGPEHDAGRKRRKLSAGHFRPSEDALVPQLLAVCQTIYHEARPVLYSENTFELELSTAIQTLMSLPQPSRSLIKQINLSVPTHHDIIEGFTDLVRLGLRYCWGLERLYLTLPPFAPTSRPSTVGSTNVYANSFQILRWLPQKTVVILDGGRTEDIDKVIEENQRVASTLDKAAYFKRQHQMPERHSSN